MTVKNSCSRNLHRLLSSVSFISSLLQNLESSSSCTLHTAAANAYNGTMAQIHTFFVRTAVKTSMYTLPTRQGFLESIGETGQHLWHSGRPHCTLYTCILCVKCASLFAAMTAMHTQAQGSLCCFLQTGLSEMCDSTDGSDDSATCAHLPVCCAFTGAGHLTAVSSSSFLCCAEASAKMHSAKFIPASNVVVQKAEALFAGTSMPKSDTTWTG